MKVFICWSGEESKQLADEIREWLPKVIQSVSTYFSPEDTDKGSRWLEEMTRELEEAKIGLICLTSENLQNEWIHFEAGALSRMLGQAHVCPLLFDVKATDLTGPLRQFQATSFEKQDFQRLLGVINECAGAEKIQPKILDNVFEKFWPDLESVVHGLMQSPTTQDKPVRPERDILEEILSLSRRQEFNSRRLMGVTISQRAIDDLLRAYVTLHDDQASQKGDYQHTLNLLKEMHRPVEYIVKRASRGANKTSEFLDRFRNLSYRESNEMDEDDMIEEED